MLCQWRQLTKICKKIQRPEHQFSFKYKKAKYNEIMIDQMKCWHKQNKNQHFFRVTTELKTPDTDPTSPLVLDRLKKTTNFYDGKQ